MTYDVALLHKIIYFLGDLGIIEEKGKAQKANDLEKLKDLKDAGDFIFANWFILDHAIITKTVNRCKSKKIKLYPELKKLTELSY